MVALHVPLGKRLAEEAFGDGNVEVAAYGNVLSAAGFLYGLAASDLQPEELDARDRLYEVIVVGGQTGPAVNPGASPQRLGSASARPRRSSECVLRRAGELPVDASRKTELERQQAALERVETTLETYNVGLPEHCRLDRVLRVLDQGRGRERQRRRLGGSRYCSPCPRARAQAIKGVTQAGVDDEPPLLDARARAPRRRARARRSTPRSSRSSARRTCSRGTR